MSVTLNPSASLGFNRPLTELIKRTLTITNHNAQPVAFKVKTTAPKLYSVRPNAGRIEPGESVVVTVQLQPMKEEPPSHVKCRDKFLVQSTTITPDKENISLAEIWNPTTEKHSEVQVHHQKIKVVYLPPEGQTLEEEPEEAAAHPSQQTIVSEKDSRQYETVRQQAPSANGHASSFPISVRQEAPGANGHAPLPAYESPASHPPPLDRPAYPNVDDSFVVAHEEQPRVEVHEIHVTPSPSPEPRQPSPRPAVNVNVRTPPPQPPSPLDRSFVSAANVSSGNVKGQDNDLAMKLIEAQNEIQRLRALLAAAPDPAEIRRRTRAALPEEVAGEVDAVSDVGTSFQEQQTSSPQEGVSPQQVGIVALLVFIITYLFF
ncbi:PapD-like protein [Gautieria morchelliformis]|nr:PapD-like protein [Gautieria morchelliformis]